MILQTYFLFTDRNINCTVNIYAINRDCVTQKGPFNCSFQKNTDVIKTRTN